MDSRAGKTVLTILSLVLIVMLFFDTFGFIPDDYQMMYRITEGTLLVPLVILAILFNRCPHCDTFIWPRRTLWGTWKWGECCPHCGGYLLDECNEWYYAYDKLNYMRGNMQVFEYRGETMLVVTYSDGMLIHVGYDEQEHEFIITVLENDSDQAKDSPLFVQRVFGETNLLKTLQQTIHEFRDNKY